MEKNSTEILSELFDIIIDRQKNNVEGSYTCYLFEKGLDKILKKVGEEASETIISAKNGENKEIILEISDLIFHLMVMMVDLGISLEEVLNELKIRAEKQKNLKKIHKVDKNS